MADRTSPAFQTASQIKFNVEKSEWKTKNFGDCAVLIRNTVPPSQFKEEPYIGLEHIGKGTLSLVGIGTAKEVRTAKTRFWSGDILFGKLRPYLRKVVRPCFSGICSTEIWVVRPTEGVDAGFLSYLMASQEFVDVVMRGSEGTTMPAATWDHVSRIKVMLPPLLKQKEISRSLSRILGTLDEKIELNRQQNETLEEIAKTLFKSWFVDFDPVRAKMEGRWRPGESLPGLPAHLYNHFPDRLAPSELGEIPKGWEVCTLDSQLAELISGARPKGGAIDSGIPSIGAENVNGLGFYDYTKEKYIPEEFFEQLKSKGANIRNGDVLLYKDGANIGRKTYLDCGFPHPTCAVNEHVFILRAQQTVTQIYLYFWLDQHWMTMEIMALNSNSAQPGINKTGVRNLPILVPSIYMLIEYNKQVDCFIKQIFNNCKQSLILANQRDRILPRVLAGKPPLANNS